MTNLSALISLALLGSCIRPIEVVEPPAQIPADLLQEEPGYQGPEPQTEKQLADAVLDEYEGRMKANAKLRTIAEITGKENGDGQ